MAQNRSCCYIHVTRACMCESACMGWHRRCMQCSVRLYVWLFLSLLQQQQQQQTQQQQQHSLCIQRGLIGVEKRKLSLVWKLKPVLSHRHHLIILPYQQLVGLWNWNYNLPRTFWFTWYAEGTRGAMLNWRGSKLPLSRCWDGGTGTTGFLTSLAREAGTGVSGSMARLTQSLHKRQRLSACQPTPFTKPFRQSSPCGSTRWRCRTESGRTVQFASCTSSRRTLTTWRGNPLPPRPHPAPQQPPRPAPGSPTTHQYHPPRSNTSTTSYQNQPRPLPTILLLPHQISTTISTTAAIWTQRLWTARTLQLPARTRFTKSTFWSTPGNLPPSLSTWLPMYPAKQPDIYSSSSSTFSRE